jgi:hypothetical protein
MNGLLIPILLVVLGVGFAFDTYRHIRRGGARHYTLEREAVLRRASGRLLISVLFFLGAVGWMIYSQQTLTAADLEPAAADVEATGEAGDAATPTPEGVLESAPPDPVNPPTPFPSPSPTPILQRGMVEGTGGSGLSLRADPSVDGETLSVLPDGSVVTILDDDPVDADGFTWIRIRTIANDEGWVAEQFLVTQNR